MTAGMNENIIRRIAYRIYQQRLRDGRPGDDKQDWFDAIKEVTNG